MTEQVSNEEQYISEFNEGLARAMRISNCWLDCNRYRKRGLFKKWNIELDTIWDEMADVAKDILNTEEYQIYLHYIRKCNEGIIENKNDKIKLYFWLRRKHRILKEIQDRVGLGIKLKKLKRETII